MASPGDLEKNIGTGASRIKEPFPALPGSVEPAKGLPARSKVLSAPEVALPMAKQSPVLDMYPARHHLTYRCIWSRASKPRHSIRLAARHSAIEVSSVHCPAFRLNGPPPTISVSGLKLPGGLNSSVVPTASPMAKPNRHPRKRSRVSIEPLPVIRGARPGSDQFCTNSLCSGVSGESGLRFDFATVLHMEASWRKASSPLIPLRVRLQPITVPVRPTP